MYIGRQIDQLLCMPSQLPSHPLTPTLKLEWLPGRYAVCRLDAAAPLPTWAAFQSTSKPKGLASITRTDRELSIVINESLVPPDVKAERGFVAMRIAGTIDFSVVGILAKLTGALAAARIPVFGISTFDTDILLIRAEHAKAASAALAPVAHIAPGMPGAS